MSRRLLSVLGLIVLLLALSFVTLQLMLLASGAQAGVGSERPAPRSEMRHPGRTVAVLESEWRRVSSELGRRAPEIEARNDG